MQNPFEQRETKADVYEGPMPSKFKKAWDYFKVEEFGAGVGVEDVSRYLAFGKPLSLKRVFADFSFEEIQEVLDLLESKQRAEETQYAEPTRPWALHLQRIYFSVMPANDGPRIEEPLSKMAQERLRVFLDALRRLGQGGEATDSELFPFDRKYFAERHFPSDELDRLAGMIRADSASMSVREEKNKRPHLGHVLRRYRAIMSVMETMYRYHDEPGLMAISVFRARANQLNGIIADLKMLAEHRKAIGINRDEDYPGYVKDDFEQLVAMLENEKLLLLDMSKKQPVPEDVSNDLSDIEEIDASKNLE